MKRLLRIVKFALIYIWVRFIRRKQLKVLPVSDEFIRMMEYACEDKEVEIDMRTLTMLMSTKFFYEHLCDGAYTYVNDLKARLFFMYVRQWVNISRGWCNGANGTDYPMIRDTDRINFGVKDADGEVYIIGYDQGNLFLTSYNNVNQDNDEGDS